MPGQKRKSKRATALLGEGYIAFTYYIILASSATLSIFNTDVIPFLMSAVGFKIGFDGLVALREADLKSINLLHKAMLVYGGFMFLLGIGMNSSSFGYVCSQYEVDGDPCSGIDLFRDFTGNRTSCSSVISGTGDSILDKCKEAFHVRTLLFFSVAFIYVLLTLCSWVFGVTINESRAKDEDPAIDTKNDIIESCSFLGHYELEAN